MNNKKGPIYYTSTIIPNFLKKYWFWFQDPTDVKQAAMVNFFSYNKVDRIGFKRTVSLTSVIDLNEELDLIWCKMRKKFTCKQIQRGERNGIIVSQDTNFKEFKKVYKKFRKEKKLTKDKFSTFKNNGIFFSAYYEKKLIAGGIFISDGENMRAWALLSLRHSLNNRTKEIVGQANRMIIWEAIKYAKNIGYTKFDLGGINPNSSDRSQVLLTEFKEGFGGKRIESYYYYKIYSRLLKYWMKIRNFNI